MTLPEDLDRPALEQRQLSRLRDLLEAVEETNPFWRPRLQQANLSSTGLRELQDLHRLPTLRKAELVADQASAPPYGTNLTQPLSAYTRLHQTSGTTSGQPLRWLDTPRNWEGHLECWRQIYRLMELEPDQRACFPFSFGPFLGFWAGFEGMLEAGRFALAAGGMSSEGRLKLLRENAINLLACTPTYALRLIEVAESMGLDPRTLGVRTVLVAGEPGGNVPVVRERIARGWGARVVDHWGMTEIGPLGVAAADSLDQLTILETECIAEILEQDRDVPVIEGEVGELVITTLGRIDSPVFRLRTGDLVRAAVGTSPSGRALLRLEGGILGRADDMLIIRGNNVFPSSVEAIVQEHAGVAEYRLIIGEHRAMQELAIEVEPKMDLTESQVASLCEQISATIKERLQFEAAVRAVPVNSLPRSEMKSRRLVRATGPTVPSSQP